jgi:hypothetical protein
VVAAVRGNWQCAVEPKLYALGLRAALGLDGSGREAVALVRDAREGMGMLLPLAARLAVAEAVACSVAEEAGALPPAVGGGEDGGSSGRGFCGALGCVFSPSLPQIV